MKIKLTLLMIFVILAGCQKDKNFEKPKADEKIITMNQITTDYDTLLKKVKNEGNEDDYLELFYALKDSYKVERTDSVMFYSKIMAKKFNYERAYFYYFEAFGEKNNINIDFSNYSKIDISELNKKEKKEAEDWLKNMVKEKIITIQQYDSIKKQ